MLNALRVVFMGSPAFAVPSLTRLLAEGHTIPLVVTQPDRPAGRGQEVRPPPVKVAAQAQSLPVLQPEKLKDAEVLAALAAARPDVIAVAAFGQYVPRAVRELPPFGCVNVHASLLPKYRGAAPIHWALIAGEPETGVTIMRIQEGLDAGPILLQRATPIAPEEDAGALHDRLAALGASALAEALRLLAGGEAIWMPQDETQVTWAPKLRDEDCRVELEGDPMSLVNRVRGLSPAPGAYLLWGGRRLKLLRTQARTEAGPARAILAIEEQALVLGTGAGALALLQVQPEGKRPMTGAEFAHGQRLQAGMRLA